MPLGTSVPVPWRAAPCQLTSLVRTFLHLEMQLPLRATLVQGRVRTCQHAGIVRVSCPFARSQTAVVSLRTVLSKAHWHRRMGPRIS